MKHFYNTPKLDGKPMVKAERDAEGQETVLLRYFKLYKSMSASQAHSHFPKSVPLTSIRRAMTNLMKAGKVEKTEKQRIGLYGKPEFIYVALPEKKKESQLSLF
jgi:hypothetical protein